MERNTKTATGEDKMASVSVPSPGKKIETGPDKGTEIGPCVEPCQHLDCEASRTTASTDCYECGNEIGYEVQYFGTSVGLIHASCAYKEESVRQCAAGHVGPFDQVRRNPGERLKEICLHCETEYWLGPVTNEPTATQKWLGTYRSIR